MSNTNLCRFHYFRKLILFDAYKHISFFFDLSFLPIFEKNPQKKFGINSPSVQR